MTHQRTQIVDEDWAAEVASAASTPPIDTDDLFSRCMGNISFAHVLLNDFESRAKQQVDAIALHTANDEFEATGATAHSLKGAAATIGAEPLRAKAAEIEAASRDGEATHLLNLVRELNSEMDRCLDFVQTMHTAAE